MDFHPQRVRPICSSSRRRWIGLRGDRPIPQLLAGDTPEVTVGVYCCSSCRHVWADPIPLPSMLLPLYEETPVYFRASEHTKMTSARTVVEELSHMTKPGRLLDVGCGVGHVLAAASEAGWEPYGIEPTASFAEAASAHGKVHVGFLDEEFDDGRFAAVTLLAVLEHVPDPVAMLAAARRVVDDGALLVLNVPNAHRPEAAMFDLALRTRREPWTVRTAPLQAPFHLSEFSTASAVQALLSSGWSPLRVRVTVGHNPYPVAPSLRRFVALVERLGARFGAGLNIDIVARAI